MSSIVLLVLSIFFVSFLTHLYVIVYYISFLLVYSSASKEIFILTLNWYLMVIFRHTIAAAPDPSYYLAMPTVRTQPQWFLAMQADISQLIFSCLKKLGIPLTPLQSLPLSGHDLDSDGVHLNALAGLKYVQSLIDQPR